MIEINLISFIGVLLIRAGNFNKASLFKYFRFQGFTSSIMLILFNFGIPNFVRLSLIIKLGMAPFHLWRVSVGVSRSYFPLIWLLTAQKIIPLNIISQFYHSYFIIIVIIFSIIYSTIYIIVQISFKKTIIASSIYRTNWVISTIRISIKISWLFFFSYSIILCTLLIILTPHIAASNFSISEFLGISSRHILTVVIWVLAGLPPSPIFFLKLIRIYFLSYFNIVILRIFLILSSIIILYPYRNIFLFFNCSSNKIFLIQLFKK